jgi:hypothetical protein
VKSLPVSSGIKYRLCSKFLGVFILVCCVSRASMACTTFKSLNKWPKVEKILKKQRKSTTKSLNIFYETRVAVKIVADSELSLVTVVIP